MRRTLVVLMAAGATAACGSDATSSNEAPVGGRAGDDTWDCERLAAERDDLFPPTPEVDW